MPFSEPIRRKSVRVCFPALYFHYIHLLRIVIGLFICLCLLWLSKVLVLQCTCDSQLKTTFIWSTTTIFKNTSRLLLHVLSGGKGYKGLWQKWVPRKKRLVPHQQSNMTKTSPEHAYTETDRKNKLPLPANQIWRMGTGQRRTTCQVRHHLQHNNLNFKKTCLRWYEIIRRLMTFLLLRRSNETNSGINCSFFRRQNIAPGMLTIYTNHSRGNLVHKHKRNGAKHLIFHVNGKYPWSSLRMLWRQLTSTWSVLFSRSDEISSKAIIAM